jgi:hypothetical protein
MILLTIAIVLLALGIMFAIISNNEWWDTMFILSISTVIVSSMFLLIFGVVSLGVQINADAVYQEAVYSKKVLEYRLEQKLDVVGNELLYSDIVEFNNMLRREKIWSSNPWVGCLHNSKVASIDYIELPIEKGGE